MFFSWQGFLKEWLKAEERARRWGGDAVRGWRGLRSGAVSLADRSFAEAETLRLRYRADRIEQKLFEAYQALGRRVSESWAGEGNPLTEEERKGASRRIELLLEERKKIMDRIGETETFLSGAERRQGEGNDAWRS